MSLGDPAVLPSSLFERLDTSLSELIRPHRVECQGAWSTSRRRTYASPSQLGSGAGPFVEVIDAQWTGALTAEVELGAIAFLATAREIFWAKAPDVSTTLPVQILLSAFADSTPSSATFSASLGGTVLPGVRVVMRGRPEDVCAPGPEVLTTGRVICLAETTDAAFLAAALPRDVLKIGRNRLWRVRDEVARQLPATLRELLTRRRAGTLMPSASAARTEDGKGPES
jgi:hypothetical protein